MSEPCPCWYGPVTLHHNPSHCCFRDDLVEPLFGSPEVACGHQPRAVWPFEAGAPE